VKKKLTTGLFVLLFLAGLSLLLYPAVSNYWNSIHGTQAVTSYLQAADLMTQAQFQDMLSAAEDYNAELVQNRQGCGLTEAGMALYNSLLDVDGNGMMGYIQIPSIDVELPIYHGTGEAVLQTSVGHLDWTSLPVGGEGTHCVLSGHRGLPSARLFTDLDKLTQGDTFTVTILNRTLTYQVDQILTVEPRQVEALSIEPGQDLCTLMTCTPYGINTHRLLVRGHRIENAAEAAHVAADGVQIRPIIVAPFAALPLLLAAYLLMAGADKKKEWDEGAEDDE